MLVDENWSEKSNQTEYTFGSLSGDIVSHGNKTTIEQVKCNKLHWSWSCFFLSSKSGASEGYLNSLAEIEWRWTWKVKNKNLEQRNNKLGFDCWNHCRRLKLHKHHNCTKKCFMCCGEQVRFFVNLLSDYKHTPTCTIGCLIALHHHARHPTASHKERRDFATVSRTWLKYIKIIKWLHSKYDLWFDAGFSHAALFRRDAV